MGFPKISTPLHTRLTAETCPADGEFLQVTVKREEFLELRGRTRLPAISNPDRKHFKHE